MNNVYEELDKAKGEIEKLKAELRDKKGSIKSLKNSHDAQINQIQEAIYKVEKLEQELLEKADEFIIADQLCGYHNSNLINKGCELEKSTFFDEVSLLKSKLESHVKISEDLEDQLRMCKQLLAQEERQRKSLEVEVIDLKLQLDCLNSQKEKDIKDLRNSLKTQEAFCKESKFSNEKLEQENHQLKKSFREFHESQEARNSYSLSTLRSSLRGLEQTHRECVSIFKTRQVEWSIQLEQMTQTIDNYRYELETKDATIEELKEMLEESTKCRTEFDFKEQPKEVYCDIDKPSFELDDRICETNEMEFELQMWRLFVDCLKNELEDNIIMRKELENSLIAEVVLSESLKQEKDCLEYKLEVEENKIDYLQLHVFVLEQALKERDTKASKQESFGRDFELMKHVTSLEKEFITSLIPFNSELAEKQAEIIQVQEVCDKITEAEALAMIEFEEKKLMVEELEDDINDMENKLKLQEDNLSKLKELASNIEMEIDTKELKVKELSDQMGDKLKDSDVLIQRIKMENKKFLENGTNSSEETSDCATADTNLADVWKSLVQSFEKDCVGGVTFQNDDGLYVKETMIVHSPTGINKPEIY